MKKIIYALFACLFLLVSSPDTSTAQRKNKKKNAPVPEMNRPPMKAPSAYDRLFTGKKVNTEKGLMTIHSLNDHGRNLIYVEFPVRLLEKEMMLTSAIEEISDAGEGIVGQFNNFVYLRFTRLDSSLMARVVTGSEGKNTTDDPNVTRALAENTNPGVWRMMKILAYTPDSSAVVVDMTNIFMEHSDYTSPFAAFGGNSMGGFAQRQHRPRPEKTRLMGIVARDNNIAVSGEYCYFMDISFMGQSNSSDIPVTVKADRILLLLPEQPMRPRLIDSRIGVMALEKKEIRDVQKGFQPTLYSLHWRMEPSDETAYRAGQLVEPKKPIIFYMDTLIPADWKKGIKDGFESWNKAFEQAGFKDVIRVVEFPRNDPKFSAMDINNSVIRYSPMWLEGAQTSMHTDVRSGEIINTSIMVHGGTYNAIARVYKVFAMASDPSARTNGALPENTRYELIKAYMAKVAGNCLGLVDNSKCNGAFPVDSLRSPSFTQKYGISSSVMGYTVYNYVASERDVAKGVRLIPVGPGEYDRYAIKWLYTPIYEATTPSEEVPILNQWIAKEKDNRNCTFGYSNRLMFDPSTAFGLLGDDPLKGMKYYLENLDYALKNMYQWYAIDDLDCNLRSTYASSLNGDLNIKIQMLMSFLGGFYVNYGEEGVTFDAVPRSVEKKYMDFFFSLMQKAPKLKAKGMEYNTALTEDPTKNLAISIFGQMFSRVEYMYFTAEKSNDTYTAEEYMNELNRRVWASTLQGRPLSLEERNMQTIMVGVMLVSSGVQSVPAPPRGPAGRPQGQRGLMDSGTCRDVYRGSCETLSGESYLDGQDHGIFIRPVADLRATREPVQHLYYSMLLKTKDMIKKAIPTSLGDTRSHYEFLLYKIDNMLTNN